MDILAAHKEIKYKSGQYGSAGSSQNKISVMLSRSSKVEHYNGLGGVYELGSVEGGEGQTDRQTTEREREREREGQRWWHGRMPFNEANPATTHRLVGLWQT